MLACAVYLLAFAPGTMAEESSASLPRWVGLSLEQALEVLEEKGLRLIYTDQLVKPELRVESEPQSSVVERILLELLAPHGLSAKRTRGKRWVIVVAPTQPASLFGKVKPWSGDRGLAGAWLELIGLEYRAETLADGSFWFEGVPPGTYALRVEAVGFLPREPTVRLRAGESLQVQLELQPIPVSIEQIEVTTEPPGILGNGLSSLTLTQGELEALPHFGDQTVRGLVHLPGAAGNDLSARFNVRGGRADEVLVQLDGLEIFGAYHLQDFGEAFSVFANETVQRIDLMTGGFPVEYGDRMAGVLDVTTIDPDWRRRCHLGVSVVQLRAGRSGSSKSGRLAYVASLRAGSLEPAMRLVGEDENPSFADAFAKLDLRTTPRTSWRLNLLSSADRLDFSTLQDDQQRDFRTRYDNLYGWATHSHVVGEDLFVSSQVSASRISRDRRGLEIDDESEVDLVDLRQLTTLGLRHEADWRSGRHFLEWGFEGRHLEIDYDYTNQRALAELLALIRDQPRNGTTRFDRRFNGQQYGLYLSDRLELGSDATFEVGLRFDENTVTDDHHLSPRLHFTYALSPRSLLRAAWGQYNQSQRPYELPVEDGELEFVRAERSQHRIVGYERVFGGPGTSRPLTLRIEAYERRIDNPRRRYENLFEPISIVPELEADRIRVEPESSRARGVEVFLGGPLGRGVEGFFTYTYARSLDRIAGRDVPRPYDQPHSLGIDLSWQTPWDWHVQAVWRFHSGWPTTGIDGTGTEENEVEPILGDLYGERLAHYDRLDLRIQRSWSLQRGSLLFYLDLQNLTNRSNLRGFDVELEIEDAALVVEKTPKTWGGLLPSLGITWTF